MVGDGVVTIVVNNPAPDTIAPVITMNGTNISLIAGTIYTDAGATCKDNRDVSCVVVTTSTVNTAVAGTYTVTYQAIDAAGNTAIPVVRTVTVTPVIKVDESNKIITAISTTTINIGTLVIHITPTTIVRLKNNSPLKVGDLIEYKGTKNTDGSVTATFIRIQ